VSAATLELIDYLGWPSQRVSTFQQLVDPSNAVVVFAQELCCVQLPDSFL
jgi:hypothetical protein